MNLGQCLKAGCDKCGHLDYYVQNNDSGALIGASGSSLVLNVALNVDGVFNMILIPQPTSLAIGW